MMTRIIHKTVSLYFMGTSFGNAVIVKSDKFGELSRDGSKILF
jgi:hypothetical protein